MCSQSNTISVEINRTKCLTTPHRTPHTCNNFHKSHDANRNENERTTQNQNEIKKNEQMNATRSKDETISVFVNDRPVLSTIPSRVINSVTDTQQC